MLKKLARFGGLLFILISFYFILNSIFNSFDSLEQWRPNRNHFIIVAVSSLIYGLLGFLLSGAWARLVFIFEANIIAVREAHILYGQTQLAKYIPGNIFHYAGRHVLGRRHGISNSALVGSSLLEILGTGLAAGMLSGAAVFFYDVEMATDMGKRLPFVILLLIIGVYLSLRLIPYAANRMNIRLPTIEKDKLTQRLLSSLLFYLVFFFCTGLLLLWVVDGISGSISSFDALFVVLIFSVAWVVGFITPGASAGVGVREAVIILFLAPSIGEAHSIIVAFLLRMVTTIGDLLFYVYVKAIPQYKHGQPQ